MNRLITKKIVEWYEKQDERILCIYGGRRIGKTWTVKGFCQQYDREYTYISLRDKEIEDIQVKLSSDATFIVLDDINDEAAYIRARRIILKVRGDMALPDYRIIMVGTRILLKENEKCGNDYMYNVAMTPLSLWEFAQAVADRWRTRKLWEMNSRDILDIYLLVGGLPECVELFLREGNFTNVRRKQWQIVTDICAEASKEKDVAYTKEWQIISSILEQEVQGNAGFSLRQVRQTARYREYGGRLEGLLCAGIIHAIKRMDHRSSHRVKDFKLYIFDVGLAGAVAGVDEWSIMKKDRLWSQQNAYLLKTFVIQQFFAEGYEDEWDIKYWHKQRAKAKLPFVFIQKKSGNITVVDIERMWNRSIHSFFAEYSDAHRENMTINNITARALKHNI